MQFIERKKDYVQSRTVVGKVGELVIQIGHIEYGPVVYKFHAFAMLIKGSNNMSWRSDNVGIAELYLEVTC